jgi:hypothetical protein
MRKLGILAVAGLSSLVLASAAAAATPPNCTAPSVAVPLAFNWAVIGTPAGALAAVNPNTAPLSAYACVNTAAGQFTIAPADFSLPAATFKVAGVAGTVQAALASPAIGQLGPQGQMAINADFTATLTVPALNGQCTVDTGPQMYSTENANLFGGKRFPIVGGQPNFLTGAGAIAGGWKSLQSQTGPACAILSAALSSGSFWISRDIAPPPTLAAKSPTSAKLTAPKSVKVMVTVTDSGVGPASNVNVCVSAPKALKVRGAKCRVIATIAAGGSTNVAFTFTASPKAKSGSYKATFKATSGSVTSAATGTTIKLKVKTKKH